MFVSNDKLVKRNRRGQNGFTLIEIMIVVLVFGILLAIAFPNFTRARESTQKKACVGNLRKIEWAKDVWLMHNNLEPASIPIEADLYGPDKFIKVAPECPNGGNYTLGAGNVEPVCDFGGGNVHLLNDH